MNITTRSFEFQDGSAELLNDEAAIHKLLNKLVATAQLTPLEYTCHQFSPQGLSATIILSESHIAVHTWPENGRGYIVLTTCSSPGDNFTSKATAAIETALKAKISAIQEIS